MKTGADLQLTSTIGSKTGLSTFSNAPFKIPCAK
ncbi:hypothetical protein CEXT_682171, partial [Caerostris extrusa]